MLTGGGPGSATTFIVQFIYMTGFAEAIRQYGLAAAASLILAVSLLVLTLLQLRLIAALGGRPRRFETMRSAKAFLAATRGRGRRDWTDWLAYAHLVVGLVLMFGPVVWLVLSSFKTPAALNEFPPQLLPYGQAQANVRGFDRPLPLYRAKLPDGSMRTLAEARRIGLVATMVDPQSPQDEFKVNIKRPRARARIALRARQLHRDLRQVRFRPRICGTACSSPSSRR